MMEAANRGSFDVGAKSVGLNISLPHEQYPNPYVTPELCFSFHYFALRKLHFLALSCCGIFSTCASRRANIMVATWTAAI
jgi:predicted Rossmann-fold nucleotide-binding protein